MGAPGKRAPHPQADRKKVSRRSALNAAARLVHQICCVAGSATLIEDARQAGGKQPLGESIERLDTPALYDWLVRVISFQGISDHAASEYIRKHGSVSWLEISWRLSEQPSCPKLQSYWHFHHCGYRKSTRTCNRPDHFANCPLPKHHLRNGRLNQAAYSLYLFLRDVTETDFVDWIDFRLSRSSLGPEKTKLHRWRESLLAPLRNVFGVSDKVLSMALADLLLAAQDARTHWHEVGATFVAIDSLAHKYLVRSGILKALKLQHPYGLDCYEQDGCTGVILTLARRIDAKEFNQKYPTYFPRFVQHAIWRFCAQDELNVCNSIRIDDRTRCSNRWCRVFRMCARRRIAP